MTRKIKPQHRVSNFDKRALQKRIEQARRTGSNIPRRLNGDPKTSKRHKYNAKGRWIADHWFPSKAEADRYEQLLELHGQGRVGAIELQPRFKCVINGVFVCTYVADFRYVVNPGRMGQRTLIEEVKGMLTPVYLLKAQLMKALHPGIEITLLHVPKRGNVGRFRFLTADEFHKAPKEDTHEPATQAGPADAGAEAEDSPARDGERAAEGGT